MRFVSLLHIKNPAQRPGLIALVMAKPLVSADLIAVELGVTPRAALRLFEELNLRAMMGGERFHAWAYCRFCAMAQNP